MTKFEVVSKYKDIDIDLIPKRATEFSAGYDFVAAEDIIVPSYKEKEWLMYRELHDWTEDGPILKQVMTAELDKVKTLEEMADFTKATNARPTLISTGIKCQLEYNQYLELVSRSSSPLKYWLVQSNAVGK